jgi:hypothetical protein
MMLHEVTTHEDPAPAISLDIVGVDFINSLLAEMQGSNPLSKVHGTISIEIVAGRFQKVHVVRSSLFPQVDKNRKRIEPISA